MTVYPVDKYGARLHPRKQLRDAIIEMLKDRTLCASRIFSNRRNVVWQPDELPAIVVNTGEEDVSTFGTEKSYPRELVRNLTVRIDVFASGADDDDLQTTVDDKMERIALQVEKIMSRADDFLDQILTEDHFHLENVIMTGMNQIIETGGEIPVGALSLFYKVTYHTQDGFGPETISGEQFIPFEGLDIDVYLRPIDNPGQDDKEADITVDVPQT